MQSCPSWENGGKCVFAFAFSAFIKTDSALSWFLDPWYSFLHTSVLLIVLVVSRLSYSLHMHWEPADPPSSGNISVWSRVTALLTLSPMTTNKRCLIKERDASEIGTTVDSITEPLSALCWLRTCLLTVMKKFLSQNITSLIKENWEQSFFFQNFKICHTRVYDTTWAVRSE